LPPLYATPVTREVCSGASAALISITPSPSAEAGSNRMGLWPCSSSHFFASATLNFFASNRMAWSSALPSAVMPQMEWTPAPNLSFSRRNDSYWSGSFSRAACSPL
jgi:hypothetical protein